jgi:hypothetical protein
MLYVSCSNSRRLLSVDPQLGTTTHMADAVARPESLAYDAARNLLWVNLQDQKRVQSFDNELSPVNSFNLAGSMPTGIIYDQQLDRLYVSVRFAVLALDAKTGSEINRVAAPAGIDQLWLDAPSRTLFAVSNGAVLLMSASEQLTVREELPIDVKGQNLAFDPQSKLIFVPGGREGRSKLLILKLLPTDPATRPMTTQQAAAK